MRPMRIDRGQLPPAGAVLAQNVLGSDGRYLQYRVVLSTRDRSRTPVLSSIGFTHNGSLPRQDAESCGLSDTACHVRPADLRSSRRSAPQVLVLVAAAPVLASGYQRRRRRARR